MDFSTIVAKVHKIHDRVIEDCIVGAQLSKKQSDSKKYQESVRALERFTVIPHMGGHTVDYLMRVLFITEGHICRHFRDSISFDADITHINNLKNKLGEIKNDTK